MGGPYLLIQTNPPSQGVEKADLLIDGDGFIDITQILFFATA